VTFSKKYGTIPCRLEQIIFRQHFCMQVNYEGEWGKKQKKGRRAKYILIKPGYDHASCPGYPTELQSQQLLL